LEFPITLAGDNVVTIAPGQTGRLTLSGVAYGATGFAAMEGESCSSLASREGMEFAVLAADMPSLVSNLPVRQLPDCIEGNDAQSLVFIQNPAQTNPETNFSCDGPIYYRSQRSDAIRQAEFFTFVSGDMGDFGPAQVDMEMSPESLQNPCLTANFGSPRTADLA
jgi:hypothetical protein